MFWRRKRTPEVHRLTDDIAIGPCPRPEDWAAIRKLGFRGIVDLQEEGTDAGALVRAEGLNYLRLPIVEHAAPAASELDELTAWIEAHVLHEGPVLIHCREGRGRSAVVAVASLVRLGLPLSESYGLLMRSNPRALINTSQMKALEAFVVGLDSTKTA